MQVHSLQAFPLFGEKSAESKNPISHNSAGLKRKAAKKRILQADILSEPTEDQLCSDKITTAGQSAAEEGKLRSKRSVKRVKCFGPDFVCPGSAVKRPKRNQEKPLIPTRKPDPGVYCICRGEDDGIRPMLQCDDCGDWFHFDCIGITEETVPEKYSCWGCESIKKKPKQKRISPLDMLIMAAEAMKKKESKHSLLTECKENTTLSGDYDRSLGENVKEIECFKVERTKKETLESLINKEGKLNELK